MKVVMIIVLTFCLYVGDSHEGYSECHLQLLLFAPSHNNVFKILKLIPRYDKCLNSCGDNVEE
jgi:hypothetical protein